MFCVLQVMVLCFAVFFGDWLPLSSYSLSSSTPASHMSGGGLGGENSYITSDSKISCYFQNFLQKLKLHIVVWHKILNGIGIGMYEIVTNWWWLSADCKLSKSESALLCLISI